MPEDKQHALALPPERPAHQAHHRARLTQCGLRFSHPNVEHAASPSTSRRHARWVGVSFPPDGDPPSTPRCRGPSPSPPDLPACMHDTLPKTAGSSPEGRSSGAHRCSSSSSGDLEATPTPAPRARRSQTRPPRYKGRSGPHEKYHDAHGCTPSGLGSDWAHRPLEHQTALRARTALDVLRARHDRLAALLGQATAHLASLADRRALLSWREFLHTPSALSAVLSAVLDAPGTSMYPGSGASSADSGRGARYEERGRVCAEERQARDQVRRLRRGVALLARVISAGEREVADAEHEDASTRASWHEQDVDGGAGQETRVLSGSAFVNWPAGAGSASASPPSASLTPEQRQQRWYGEHQQQQQQQEQQQGAQLHEQDFDDEAQIDVVATVVAVLRMLDPRDLAGVLHELGLFDESARLMSSLS